jgi:glutaredoxin
VLKQIEGTVPVVSVSSAATSMQIAGREVSDAADAEVVLYCARWCKDCRKAKAWLEERSLSYVEVDIDLDLGARKKIREWTNGRLITPAFEICGTVVLDFDIPKLEQALANRSTR